MFLNLFEGILIILSISFLLLLKSSVNFSLLFSYAFIPTLFITVVFILPMKSPFKLLYLVHYINLRCEPLYRIKGDFVLPIADSPYERCPDVMSQPYCTGHLWKTERGLFWHAMHDKLSVFMCSLGPPFQFHSSFINTEMDTEDVACLYKVSSVPQITIDYILRLKLVDIFCSIIVHVPEIHFLFLPFLLFIDFYLSLLDQENCFYQINL